MRGTREDAVFINDDNLIELTLGLLALKVRGLTYAEPINSSQQVENLALSSGAQTMVRVERTSLNLFVHDICVI